MDKIIFNGGDPLEGCPESWEEANAWTKDANGDNEEWEQPLWSFDCGFKLDYDGPILRINSRFYPPKTHYGPTWDGSVTVYIFDKEVEERKFDCKTLGELKQEVDKYISELRNRIESVFNK